MSNLFLLLRQRIEEPGERAFLQQQAILAIARSILAVGEQGGRGNSGRRLIAPADDDILPLLTVLADDYAEFIEPESPSSFRRLEAPFILYGRRTEASFSEYERPPEDHLRLQWFNTGFIDQSLSSIVAELRPTHIIVMGNVDEVLLDLTQDQRPLPRLIGFSDISETSLEGRVIMIDEAYRRFLEEPLRDGERHAETKPTPYWRTLFDREMTSAMEQGPFISFGPAFEKIVLTIDNL